MCNALLSRETTHKTLSAAICNCQVLLQLYSRSIAESKSNDDDTSQWEYSLISSAYSLTKTERSANKSQTSFMCKRNEVGLEERHLLHLMDDNNYC